MPDPLRDKRIAQIHKNRAARWKRARVRKVDMENYYDRLLESHHKGLRAGEFLGSRQDNN